MVPLGFTNAPTIPAIPLPSELARDLSNPSDPPTDALFKSRFLDQHKECWNPSIGVAQPPNSSFTGNINYTYKVSTVHQWDHVTQHWDPGLFTFHSHEKDVPQ